jgi:hypothetical protein
MLVKVVTLFLLAMVLIGMVGKLLFPGASPRSTRRRGRFCPDCGRPLIGKSCDCKGKA